MTSPQDTNRLEDWSVETRESIAARLEGAKAAQAKTRLTLGTMAVISVMMLIAAYNAYLSYDYDWIVKVKCPENLPSKNGADTASKAELKQEKSEQEKPDVLRDQAYRDWATARIVLISLLGIRVSVDDAGVLGSAVLLVLSLWLLLVTRRENHTIGFLLRDTDTQRPDGDRDPPPEGRPGIYSGGERWLIFHTIISNSLFVTFDHLAKVNSLDGPDSLTASATGEDRGWWNRAGLKLIRNFFFWFPAITALAVFGLDRWSYFIKDPFDPNCAIQGVTDFFKRSMAVFFVCWIPLVICCWRSSQYSRATEKVLREYGNKLHADLLQQKRAPQG